MGYQVHLVYFKPAGKLLSHAKATIEHAQIEDIWEEIHELRRIGRLPGLRVNSGRDLYILVDVVAHPDRRLHLVMPPVLEEEDVTPIRIPTGEMEPLVRLPLESMPRTSTRDVVKPSDDEITPVDPFPTVDPNDFPK